MIHKLLFFNVEDVRTAELIEEKTSEILAQVPGTKNVSFRRAVQTNQASEFEYLITVDFDSMEDHERYLVDETHVRFSGTYFRPNIKDLQIYFFES